MFRANLPTLTTNGLSSTPALLPLLPLLPLHRYCPSTTPPSTPPTQLPRPPSTPIPQSATTSPMRAALFVPSNQTNHPSPNAAASVCPSLLQPLLTTSILIHMPCLPLVRARRAAFLDASVALSPRPPSHMLCCLARSLANTRPPCLLEPRFQLL